VTERPARLVDVIHNEDGTVDYEIEYTDESGGRSLLKNVRLEFVTALPVTEEAKNISSELSWTWNFELPLAPED